MHDSFSWSCASGVSVRGGLKPSIKNNTFIGPTPFSILKFTCSPARKLLSGGFSEKQKKLEKTDFFSICPQRHLITRRRMKNFNHEPCKPARTRCPISSPFPMNLCQLRLFQNFSFWNSYSRLIEKADFRTLFPELVTKLTKFWNKLSSLRFQGN